MAGDPTGRISHLPWFHRGVSWKQPCRVATTGNITISTALNNGDTIDGVTLATGDRVLVKDQSTASQNGIYLVGATPIRDFDMDQDGSTAVPAEEVLGAFVYVIAGTTNGGTLWKNTNTSAPTVGTTALTFTQFTGSALTDHTHAATGSGSNGGGATLSPGTLNLPTATSPAQTADGQAVWDSDDDVLTIGDGSSRKTIGYLGTTTPSVESGAGSAGSAKETSRADHVHPAAGGSGTLSTVEEVDGSPTDSAVTKLVFPNGTLSITSHVATYTPAGGGGSSIPDQSVPYPTSASGDDDLMASTAGWSDVGTDAFTTFSSDGHRILLVIGGASKSSTIRKTLGTTKAAAFDFRFGILPHIDYWSSGGDTYVRLLLLTSGGSQIAGFEMFATTARSIGIGGAGSGAFTDSHSFFAHHTPLSIRMTRDGSNVCSFYVSGGSTPFDLAQLRQPNTGTYLAPLTFTSSGTVARVEVNVVTGSGHNASALNGALLDYFVSA